jgi:Toprim-like
MQAVDPLLMPVTGETPQERLARSFSLLDTPGQHYIEKRGIPVDIAHNAGIRFDPDWNGRAAIIAPMFDSKQTLCSLHGRYLVQEGKQDKMFTIGPGGGMFSVGESYQNDRVILVEGVFDALSLAVCGYSCLATVGRKAPWLPEVCKGKLVVLAFDANNPGEEAVDFYKQYITEASFHRLTPPGHIKDWNSALLKRGADSLEHWLHYNLDRLITENNFQS